MSDRNKINWILILQAWAILWVVIGHSFMTLPFDDLTPWYVIVSFDFAYSFHMALFIFVSGYLFYLTRVVKQKSYGKMILEKLNRLGIPFVVFTLLAMVVKTIFAADMSRQTSINIREFLMAIVYPYDGPMREFWFLAVIMWMFLARPLWIICLRNKWSVALTIMALLLVKLFVPTFANDLFCFPRALQYAIFFFLGMVTCKWNFVDVLKKKELFLACSVILYIVAFLFLKHELRIIIPFLGIFMSIMLALVLDKYLPRVFLTFRNYTYQIYLMAIFFQIGTKALYDRDLISYGGGVFAMYNNWRLCTGDHFINRSED